MKHLRLGVINALLLSVLAVALLGYRAHIMRNAEYARVFTAVAHHPAVTEQIGTPVEQDEWLPRRHTPQHNLRETRVLLRGPRGTGELLILTTLIADDEITSKVSFTPADADTIPLDEVTTF